MPIFIRFKYGSAFFNVLFNLSVIISFVLDVDTRKKKTKSFPVQRKVLDASGHVAPGFVWGNNYWLGSRKACQFINSRAPVVLSHELRKNHFENLTYIESPFPVEYKLVWAKHHSSWQVDISTFEKVFEKKEEKKKYLSHFSNEL